ncbi:MAG: hypothetical protein V3V14_10910 [Saprospiraceae bacterium]
MKKFGLFTMLLLLMLTSCQDDECKTSKEVFQYDPVYKTLEEIEKPEIKVDISRAIKNPGKVYYIGNTLFVSEIGEGVHIIDNTDKSNPVPLSFLEIPGNIDVSFRGNSLIADSYFNILFIDISDLDNPVVTSSINDIKKQYYHFDKEKEAYIVDYTLSKVHRDLPCNHPFFSNPNRYYYDDVSVYSNVKDGNVFNDVFTEGGFSPNTSGGSPGVAGSNSSFALVGDYFYFIHRSEVEVYNITDVDSPIFSHGFTVDWNIETLFPYEDKLFIGGRTGMYIYDNSDPSEPVYLSEFNHARACDPVFVVGKTAYVTLSSGTRCQNFNNQLDVIDISNILAPVLIESYPMYRPKGLSIYDNTLFLCDDKAGLKIFDVSDNTMIKENKLSAIKGHTFIEVIHTSPTEIMVIGPDGIFQYDVSDNSNPKLLSQMNIED